MELLQISQSVVTYFTQVRRPQGQLFLPLAVRKLAERYQFQAGPNSFEDMVEPPIEFRHGLFQDSAIANFKIYNDGVIVSSASDTSLIDNFIADLFGWMGETLGLSEIEYLRLGKVYESALVVKLEIDPDKLIPWAGPTVRFLATKMEQYGRRPTPFQFGQVNLMADPHERAINSAGFSIERRQGVPFDQGVYFSTAPLKTTDHLEALSLVEKSITR